MDRSIPLLIIGLVFGGAIGFTIAAANGVTLDDHDHADPAQHAAPAGTAGEMSGASNGHDHSTAVILPDGDDAPSLSIDVRRDPSSGWNLHLVTANFTFSPENASLAHVPGEGHAHVYINGVKRGRVYGSWVHLDNLPAGDVSVEVTLNANDHRPFEVGGERVADAVTIRN